MKAHSIIWCMLCTLITPALADDLTFNGTYQSFNCQYDRHLKCDLEGYCGRIRSFASTIIDPNKRQIMIGPKWVNITKVKTSPMTLNAPLTGTFAIEGVDNVALVLRVLPDSMRAQQPVSFTVSMSLPEGLEIEAGACRVTFAR